MPLDVVCPGGKIDGPSGRSDVVDRLLQHRGDVGPPLRAVWLIRQVDEDRGGRTGLLRVCRNVDLRGYARVGAGSVAADNLELGLSADRRIIYDRRRARHPADRAVARRDDLAAREQYLGLRALAYHSRVARTLDPRACEIERASLIVRDRSRVGAEEDGRGATVARRAQAASGDLEPGDVVDVNRIVAIGDHRIQDLAVGD